MSQKSSQDAKNIGARFRSARSLVPDLNRKLFCERHGINRYTMQSWENGLHVSKGRNVEKFIEALAREGVCCTSEWLIEGVGEPARPMFKAGPFIPNEEAFINQEQASEGIERSIKALEASYAENGQSLVRFLIPDDAMAPKFVAGDTVFGCQVKEGEEKSVHQKFCIVELGPKKYVVRKAIVHKESYILLALDDRVPSFSLNLDSRLFVIVWQLIQQ